MKFTARQRPRALGFEMTPMVDVVLQLIIFFMVTSQVSRLVRSEVDLPSEPGRREAARQQEDLFIIDVSRDGLLIAESRVITRERFLAMVRAEIARVDGDPEAVRLLVRADRQAPTSAVNRVARDLADLGVRGWRIGTTMPAGSNAGQAGDAIGESAGGEDD